MSGATIAATQGQGLRNTRESASTTTMDATATIAVVAGKGNEPKLANMSIVRPSRLMRLRLTDEARWLGWQAASTGAIVAPRTTGE